MRTYKDYKEALFSISFTLHNRVKPMYLRHVEDKWLDVLQELVDKATPKKLIHDIVSDSYDEDGLPESFEYEVRKCPNCREHLVDESEDIDFSELPYCPYCGKALDWSEENEAD